MSIRRIGGAKSGSGGQILPFSRATVAGGFVFVSGQVGMDETGEIVQGGIVAETRRTMDNIIAILAEAGCTLNDVVKASVWLDDTRDFAAFNRVYASYFKDELPARSCVRSQIMIDAKVEIDVIAYRPET
ncbi:Rid family detoxifying hydrolase [Asticcacaulis sp. EMRT-3]|uniref:RidA family protein n=1 Tax=Asticcacaulis sp. EMRT-3 TaxID=3040349 RepID=UPI0024AFD2CE|nr:Rid family detoxifying hydrolase [Asticcacaulis sp. EMRT-3]MDI7775760.1 Rid family detoxifying hydrolase [Asticcacaulis sp. EMRT-3]